MDGLYFSVYFSMMLLVGHRKNTIQRTANLVVVVMSRVDMLQDKQILQLHNLVSYGMKPLVITMILLLVSIMMEIQVFQLSLCFPFEASFSAELFVTRCCLSNYLGQLMGF